ncbi:hypothetical protein CAOG_02970 [Capsaspora owczarzaki ATCC 30864]|uniref:Uncharacterized protein n=1 Tax=Capsaspora owczarzaki (strain ATCC 30864) TaxID=595528 RepID=A0A0D2X243_CAPO3|nr:hypothetical protein CAOG_02970 [Capsaspora owczarzaki ATCC 30864]KJE91909.1 hypothetical protein CAOG_002970 [Capsaspora owczarzaki ATCC 30864]|eukprot:XP_004363809.2 hypothetical protein CAOG_02970 [Capsaspora owczarzaki ATCC 30864]
MMMTMMAMTRLALARSALCLTSTSFFAVAAPIRRPPSIAGQSESTRSASSSSVSTSAASSDTPLRTVHRFPVPDFEHVPRSPSSLPLEDASIATLSSVFTPQVTRALYRAYLREIRRVPRLALRERAKQELRDTFIGARVLVEAPTRPERARRLWALTKFLFAGKPRQNLPVPKAPLEILYAIQNQLLLPFVESPQHLLAHAIYTLQCMQRASNPLDALYIRSAPTPDFDDLTY